MDRVPRNHRLAERRLVSLVASGEWEIDADGQIWRVKRRKGCRDGSVQTISIPRRRAEHQMPSGYLMVHAWWGIEHVNGLAHRVVWQHFVGDIPPGMVINHKNGIKNDNRPENLEILSYSGNTKHAYRAGLMDEYGQRNPAAKLTNNEVAQIRLAYASGNYTMEQLGKRFSVRFQHISRIVRGQRRPKQGGPIENREHRHNACERDPVTGRFMQTCEFPTVREAVTR